MKYFLWGLLVCALALGGYVNYNSANAGLWEKLSSLGDETVPTTSFTIEAKGWNLRGYIFQPPNTNKTCLFVAGSKKGGLTCW